jgi:RNA polymerase sigma-70 factor (ECF subfamily)
MLDLVSRETQSNTNSEMGDEPVSNEWLLARIAEGDQGAFARLYDATAPRVLGLIRRVLIDPAQSEEVAQEVFLEIWQNAPRFDGSKGTASAWIMTMAHRRAIDRIRASQSGRDRDVKIGIRDIAVSYDNVAETVETTIEHERVQVAMAQLTELQRQAVTLAYYGGHTQSEVAELLDIPLGTVKTRLRDGLIRLRDELGVAS